MPQWHIRVFSGWSTRGGGTGHEAGGGWGGIGEHERRQRARGVLVIAQGLGEPALMSDQFGEQRVFEDGFEGNPLRGHRHHRNLVRHRDSGAGDAKSEQGDELGVRNPLAQGEFSGEGSTQMSV